MKYPQFVEAVVEDRSKFEAPRYKKPDIHIYFGISIFRADLYPTTLDPYLVYTWIQDYLGKQDQSWRHSDELRFKL